MNKTQLRRFIGISLALSIAHLILLLSSIGVYVEHLPSPSNFFTQTADIISTILSQPLDLLPDWTELSFPFDLLLLISHSLLWGFTLTSIIYFFKKRKKQSQKPAKAPG